MHRLRPTAQSTDDPYATVGAVRDGSATVTLGGMDGVVDSTT